MIAFLEGSLLISPADAADIAQSLRLRNPAWAQTCALVKRAEAGVAQAEDSKDATRIGKAKSKLHKLQYLLRQCPEWIEGCRARDMDGSKFIAVPRMAEQSLNGLWPINHQPSTILRRTTYPPAVPTELAGFEPRPYQQDALAAFLVGQTGIIEAPCGSGKTMIGLMAIAALPTTALVLVHTLDLAEQWLTRCRQNLAGKICPSMIGDSSWDESGRVVIATIQTLVANPWEWRREWGRKFGLVILDEAHHCPAETFADVISSLPAQYRLGLTATPERSDGLTDLLHWHFGQVVYRVTNEHLAAAGVILLPEVRYIRTEWTPSKDFSDPEFSWVEMLSEMGRDERRNALILHEVKRLVVEQARRVLILSERVAHCEILAIALRESGIAALELHGQMKKAERSERLEKTRTGATRVLCATNLADEGLDIPGLDAVVLTMPVAKALGKLQQRIGRVMRCCAGKRLPVILDFVDNCGPLRGLARRRAKLYASIGCLEK